MFESSRRTVRGLPRRGFLVGILGVGKLGDVATELYVDIPPGLWVKPGVKGQLEIGGDFVTGNEEWPEGECGGGIGFRAGTWGFGSGNNLGLSKS